jgi:3alpha(or 20beta)-hydroxysteroid dehydrogenase
MARLQNKAAIITGGARGMGAATARVFVAEGAKVVIADVLDNEGAKLAAELGGAAIFQRHDVADENSWSNVLDRAIAAFGGVDVLVNNAGVLMFKTLLTMEKADFERVLSVNLVGAFLGIKTVAPHMIARGKGSIVNVSSVDGMKGSNGLAAYGASKWGVRGLTRVAALELGYQGVRVNSIHPGGVDTMMTNPMGQSRAEVDQRFKMVPLQRVGAPEEVARATLFLASDDSSYVCGAEIAVDGGMLAGQYYFGYPGAPDEN